MSYNFWESQVKSDDRRIAECKDKIAQARRHGDTNAARTYESSLGHLESIRNHDMINFQKDLVKSINKK